MPRREPLKLTPLQLVRQRLGLTQRDLARRVGCHPASISLAESGFLSTDMARRLAKVLGMQPEELRPAPPPAPPQPEEPRR